MKPLIDPTRLLTRPTKKDADDETIFRYDMDLTSPISKAHFTGHFVGHLLTVGDKSRVGQLRNQLNGGTQVDQATWNMHHCIATLSFALDECPDWFDMENLVDESPLWDCYEKYSKWVDGFFRRMRGEAGDAPGTQPGQGQGEGQGQG